jgi:energy-coupling factor transporter ATP-binding protein EcfA2
MRSGQTWRSEIRHSIIENLLDKVERQAHAKYLTQLKLTKIRHFAGATINFDFPVVALIGPNGGGKTTILATCGCLFSGGVQQRVFQKSHIADTSMDDWLVEYELIDKDKSPNANIRGKLSFAEGLWVNSQDVRRNVRFLSLMRTLPLAENPTFYIRSRITSDPKNKHRSLDYATAELPPELSNRIRGEGEKILGRSLQGYKFLNVTVIITKVRKRKTSEEMVLPDGRTVRLKGPLKRDTVTNNLTQIMYVGANKTGTFSELNFGAGESSVLRIIADIESSPNDSLVLIDEIENGIHPAAVRRLAEYLIDVAARKGIQTIFTTHSDYATDPLPGEAIWACLDGRLQQGKLSVAALRAISGRIDKRLAVFVEDDFVTDWVLAVIREKLPGSADEVGIYPIGGDGSAVKAHLAHSINPSIDFKSLCYIDGDSRQKDDPEKLIYRMPGTVPEITIFKAILLNLEKNLASLTLSCQRPISKQHEVADAVLSVSRTNRDPHLLFAQVAQKLSFMPEVTVRGAFLSIWIQENSEAADQIAEPIARALRPGSS